MVTLPMIVVLASLAAVAAVLASLPGWLPPLVVRLRGRVFTAVNGEEGVSVPGELVGIERFEELYASPIARGRSRGAPLSDLFWYWLAPGPEIHQEHIEPGAKYEEVAHATRRILAVPKRAAEDLASAAARRVLAEAPTEDVRVVRLRDLMMPIWAEVYHELVFGGPPTRETRDLIVANADDVVTALKCCSLRHMDRRERLTRHLAAEIARGRVRHELPASLSTKERALYLQGVFFNTAIVQSSEAMAHLLLALAEHRDVQERLHASLDDDRAIDRVVTESLRAYPLFGIAHRITSDAIPLEEGRELPAGTVLCFDYAAYHRTGYADPTRFDPDRWTNVGTRDAHYLPFGIAENRACPAQAMALITVRGVTREVMRRFTLASSAEHTRSLPNRGPCLLVPRGRPLPAGAEASSLARMRVRDRWENVGRSVVQLVLGTYMVLDARRLGLCRNHFAQADRAAPPASGQCPFQGSKS